jgi:hypothetical protein
MTKKWRSIMPKKHRQLLNLNPLLPHLPRLPLRKEKVNKKKKVLPKSL